MLMLPQWDLSVAVPDWFQNAGDEIGGAAETAEEPALAIPITTVAIICALTHFLYGLSLSANRRFTCQSNNVDSY